MSTYLRFTNKCIFRSRETVAIDGVDPFIRNEAYQLVPNPAYEAAGGESFKETVVPCVFLYLANNQKESPAQENEDIIEIVIGDTIIPKYTDKITNITSRKGVVIENGPLEIIGIKRYAGYQGELHHYRIRTRRMKDC